MVYIPGGLFLRKLIEMDERYKMFADKDTLEGKDLMALEK